jgi:hypothetical protein
MGELGRGLVVNVADHGHGACETAERDTELATFGVIRAVGLVGGGGFHLDGWLLVNYLVHGGVKELVERVELLLHEALLIKIRAHDVPGVGLRREGGNGGAIVVAGDARGEKKN